VTELPQNVHLKYSTHILFRDMNLRLI